MVVSTLVRSAPSSNNCSIVFSFSRSSLSNCWPPRGLALVGTSFMGARRKLVQHKPNFPLTLMPVLSLRSV